MLAESDSEEMFVTLYSISEESLGLRLQQLQLTKEEQARLQSKAEWAISIAPEVVEGCMEWQCTLPHTRLFFEKLQECPLQLEERYTSYVASLFSGEPDGWGRLYFARRLAIGSYLAENEHCST